MQKKRLDKKYQVHFKIYDVTTWLPGFFPKSYTENDAGRLVPHLFLFFKEALHEVKASGLQLSFNVFR